jgi:ketosteroid isomerase-like protein
MSQENVDVVRQLYSAMNARELEAVAELADPDVEWIPDSRVGQGPIRGRENIIRFFMDQAETFEEFRVETKRFWDTGDKVLVFVRTTGRGTASGAGFDIRIGHLWTLRDGLIVRGEGHANRDEALEAAGLME